MRQPLANEEQQNTTGHGLQCTAVKDRGSHLALRPSPMGEKGIKQCLKKHSLHA